MGKITITINWILNLPLPSLVLLCTVQAETVVAVVVMAAVTDIEDVVVESMVEFLTVTQNLKVVLVFEEEEVDTVKEDTEANKREVSPQNRV